MKIFVAIVFVVLGSLSASAQCPVMPEGYLCVTRAVGEKALQDADKVKSQENELKARDVADEILKKALQDMTVEYVKASSELTVYKQFRIDDRLLIDTLLKKRKCATLSICIGGN